jgi:lysozyme
MKLSRAGANQLLAEEGIALKAYRCSGNVLTIGAGHTAAAGPPAVKEGDTITLAQALDMFLVDIVPYEQAVRRAVKVTLLQHEFDALVLFHYNTGAISSGSIDDKLNRGDRAGALATWRSYNKAGGKISKGLVARRARETAMFERGIYATRNIQIIEADGRKRSLYPNSYLWPGAAADPTPPPVPTPPVQVAPPVFVPPPPDVEPPPPQEPPAPSLLARIILAIAVIFRRKA